MCKKLSIEILNVYFTMLYGNSIYIIIYQDEMSIDVYADYQKMKSRTVTIIIILIFCIVKLSVVS